MMLHWSPRSPFVRKVVIVLHERGLLDRVELRRSVVMLAAPPNEEVLADNPLGKIPTLVRDDGPALFDSRVVCEYLDGLDGTPQLVPTEFGARIECLRWQSLGDGLTDLLLLWRTEVSRGEAANAEISAGYDRKARAALARLEQEVPQLREAPFGLGHVAIICALGQLDFRYAESGWKAAYPSLADWFAEMRQRPSVAATEVQDDSGAAMGEVAMPLRFGEAA